MLRGELVNKNCKRESVCLKCGEGQSIRIVRGSPSVWSAVKGSSMQIVRSRPSVLRGELVNEDWWKEPICLKYSEGLVNKNCKKEPVCLECSEGLVNANSKSSSICVEGRARQ